MRFRAKVWLGLAALALAVAGTAGYFAFWAGGPAGEGALRACRAVRVIDEATGQPVVGVEDIVVDEESKIAYLSAYDRRQVRVEKMRGQVETQGGIYALSLDAFEPAAGTLRLPDLVRDFRRHSDFRPHGIGFLAGDPPLLFAINRLDDGERQFSVVDVFEVGEGELFHLYRFSDPSLCTANDLLPLGRETFLISHDREHCSGFKRRWEEAFGPRGGFVTRYKAGDIRPVVKRVGFPNGLALFTGETGRERVVVAHTLDRVLAVFETDEVLMTNDPFDGFLENIPLPGPPDNLTVDARGDLYIAVLPKPFRFAWYIGGLTGKTPTSVLRLRRGRSDASDLELLVNDNGTLISSATVAARMGDYLILGAGWDDHIAICSGMGALD